MLAFKIDLRITAVVAAGFPVLSSNLYPIPILYYPIQSNQTHHVTPTASAQNCTHNIPVRYHTHSQLVIRDQSIHTPHQNRGSSSSITERPDPFAKLVLFICDKNPSTDISLRIFHVSSPISQVPHPPQRKKKRCGGSSRGTHPSFVHHVPCQFASVQTPPNPSHQFAHTHAMLMSRDHSGILSFSISSHPSYPFSSKQLANVLVDVER